MWKKLFFGVAVVATLVILSFFAVPRTVVVTVDADEPATRVTYSLGDSDHHVANVPFELEKKGASFDANFLAESGNTVSVSAVVKWAWVPISRVSGAGAEITVSVTRARAALRATS